MQSRLLDCMPQESFPSKEEVCMEIH